VDAGTGRAGRDRDFAGKLVARALPLDLPLTQIMTTPVIAVERAG